MCILKTSRADETTVRGLYREGAIKVRLWNKIDWRGDKFLRR